MGPEGREEGTNGKVDRKREGVVEGKAGLGGLHCTQKRERWGGWDGQKELWVGSTALGTLCVVTPASCLI